jgi:hypothetical protein
VSGWDTHLLSRVAAQLALDLAGTERADAAWLGILSAVKLCCASL